MEELIVAQNTQKTYFVTGANRGIGLELTRQLLSKDQNVIATARRPNEAKELKGFETTHGNKFQLLPLDVKSDNSAQMILKDIRFPHVDVLINNAGILPDEDGAIFEVSPALILEAINVNAIGPVRVTQALLPLLRKSRAPVVANITSLMGSIADNSSGSYLAYRMSKTALNMFVKNLALDEKSVISLALHPGWVKTDMGGPNALIETEKSATGLLSIIENATKAESGKFFNFTGKELQW